ncbi:ALP1-like protein isoform X1 [Tanacetum coccineum]|uniref:ALP1-like protein isoform X1 n=1 Tax=Tanacetum coccineum TaxID=301880 RepID=A0ABQ5D151_9ASTR
MTQRLTLKLEAWLCRYATLHAIYNLAIRNPSSVKKAFRDHYEARFNKPTTTRLKLSFPFPKRLSTVQVDDLERGVSHDEIRSAVWDCGDNKSPGPDGFTFEFFKKYWRSINSLSTTNNSHNHDFDNDTVNKNDQILNEFDHEEIVLVTDPDPDGVTVIENNPPDSFWERTKADVSAPHWSANDWLALGGTKILSTDQSGADTSTLFSPYREGREWSCHGFVPSYDARLSHGAPLREVGGLSSGPIRRRRYIYREQEEAKERLIDDYFGDEEYEPKYPKETFRRRYRMSSTLFNKIVNDILSYDVQPIPEYFTYFSSRLVATSRKSIDPILKCTSAIRQLAYGTAPDVFDEYLQIAERTSQECLDNFTKCIHVLYNHKFLRRPSATDIKKTYKLHEEKHGLPGMFGSIDCMHWDWKNCPKSLHGQFKIRDHKYPTLMLEAVADQRLWIWHAYFGVPGANNDLNVLYGSPLFDDEIADIAQECPFIVNGHTYKKGYYLADGIYPEWSTFVKTFSVTRDAKTFKFKTIQEAARKDIERTFGVLQGRWGIIRQPARAMQINNIKRNRTWLEVGSKDVIYMLGSQDCRYLGGLLLQLRLPVSWRGDDDQFLFSTRGLPSPVSWLGSHTKRVIAAMSGTQSLLDQVSEVHLKDYRHQSSFDKEATRTPNRKTIRLRSETVADRRVPRCYAPQTKPMQLQCINGQAATPSNRVSLEYAHLGK